VVDPDDYEGVAMEVEQGGVSQATRERLAVKAFRHTADYDSAIDRFLSERLAGEQVLRLAYGRGTVLRYGENGHQRATLYRRREGGGVAGAVQLHGREMSYNNYLDAHAAVGAARDVAGGPAAVVIKHGNPCGFATGPDLATALARAWNGDRESAMGSVIAVSRRMDRGAAEFLRTSYRSPLIEGERRRFIEIVIAPGFDPDALDLLRRKSKDLRLLEIAPFDAEGPEPLLYRQVSGGLLEQSRDDVLCARWEVVTRTPFPESRRGLGEFAMKAARHTKSNAIVLAREYAAGHYEVIGMGAGQPNRVDSLRKLAISKARENFECEFAGGRAGGDFEAYVRQQLSEAVMASDALFPYDDTVTLAHGLGIRYIVQPGGSVMTGPGGGDAAVIATADRLGVAMVFTGTRHFLH
jgi:phosphoribosylaminoimidazolecarboxamide formyltransferase/IMP cyclohydrolase